MHENSKILNGEVALVTGGARGIGAAVSKALAEAGAAVLAADTRKPVNGAFAESIELDLRSEEQVARAMDRTLSKHGRLDILVNNAGINVTAPVEQLSLKEWDDILAVNLRAPFLLSKLAFQAMRPQKSGSIYHASKWGLLGLSHALHVEARPDGIKVTAVIPGGMKTPFLLEAFPDIDTGTLQDPSSVAKTVLFLLTVPDGTVIPEIMVLPMRETSWP